MKNLIINSFEREQEYIPNFQKNTKKGKIRCIFMEEHGRWKNDTKSFISTQMILISIKIIL